MWFKQDSLAVNTLRKKKKCSSAGASDQYLHIARKYAHKLMHTTYIFESLKTVNKY